MTGIFSGLQTLINLFTGPFQLIIGILKWLHELLNIITYIVLQLKVQINSLPIWLQAFAILGISIMVLFRILGRETK